MGSRIILPRFVLRRAHGLAVALAVLSSAATDSCTPAAVPPPPTRVLIETGRPSRVFRYLGDALAKVYNQKIPGIVASAELSEGSVFNVRAVQDGRAELAFTQSDVAYFAFHAGTAGDPRPYTRLRAVAALYVSAVHVVVPRDSPIRTLADLKGRRIAVGRGGAAVASQVILDVQGLGKEISREPLDIEQEVGRLKSGEIDAGFLVGPDPVPALTQLNAALKIRFVAIDADLAERTRAQYPFFRPFTIPAHQYEGHDVEVKTLGIDNVLVCRADLPDRLVYSLTKAFVESIDTMSQAHPAVGPIDPEQASATAIPLHPGAALYYRERELFK